MLRYFSIIFTLIILIGCSGGGGGSGGGDNSTSLSASEGSDSPLDGILTEEEIDSLDDDFSKVGRAVDTEDFESQLKALSTNPIEFDFAKTGVFDIGGIPVNYVTVYKRELGRRVNKLFNVNVISNYGESVEHYMGDPSFIDKPGVVKKFIHQDDQTIVVTRNPLQIFKLDNEEKKVVHLQTGSNRNIRSISSFGNLICGHHLNKNKELFIFQYKINENELTERVLNFGESVVAAEKLHGSSHCFDGHIFAVTSVDGEHNLVKFDLINQNISKVNLSEERDRRYHFYHSQTAQVIRLQLRKGELRERNLYQYFQPQAGNYFEVSSKPLAKKNQFSQIRVYASKASATLDNPKVSLIYSDRKKSILAEDIVKDIELESYQPQFYQLFKKKDALYATLQGNSLYKFNYDEDKFERVGYTNGRKIASINYVKEDMYLMANNGQVFKYDKNEDWSYGTIENIKLKYNDSNQNPMYFDSFKNIDIQGKKLQRLDYSRVNGQDVIVQGRLSDKNGGVLFSYDLENKSLLNSHLLGSKYIYRGNQHKGNEIIYGTKYIADRKAFTNEDSAFIGNLDKKDFSVNAEKVSIPLIGNRDIHSIRIFGDTYSFVSGNKLYSYNINTRVATPVLRFSGVRSHSTIKTPNEKLLVLNDSQVILIDPVKLTTEILFVIQDETIKRINTVRLFDDKLVYIDQSNSPKIIHLSFSKLNLIDEVE
ncbi:MAG: hypothetical protein GY909_09670 [Oligoflexia bacterium]|nr:hypothetical protein [Oligoflexia bacterium]